MTYNDGILTIWQTKNIAPAGAKPKDGLIQKFKSFFRFDVVGLNRYYTALNANQQIDNVVAVPDWQEILINDICTLEDDNQYVIRTVQHEIASDGLKETRVSLERLVTKYDVAS